ncbi:uncharacterized protein LOC143179934 isoform X2 [Calliopsis andreniformis]|uniref:uncharacterized protein LOC143179934 isoform X2 n=1 Tax=Calliopsis andreniformis TaxID=337506 RepID=UPI003FCD54A3
MTRFIIFATLLIVQFNVGLSDDVIEMDVGRNVYLDTHFQNMYKIKTCELETNIGEKFTYTPYAYDITDRISRKEINYYRPYKYIYPRRDDNEKQGCSVYIYEIQVGDSGKWTIRTNFTNETIPPIMSTFKICSRQEVKVIPSSNIEVVDGYYVHAQLNKTLMNLTECTVTAPNGTRIDLLTEERQNFYKFGNCGFRALMNLGDKGSWKLIAVDNDVLLYTGIVNIIVKEDKLIEYEILPLKRGVMGHLNFEINTEFCELEDPMGVLISNLKSCHYTIPVVTIRDEGIWKLRYTVYGKQDLTVITFKVTTYDFNYNVNSSLTLTENNEIQLFCSGKVYESNSLCLFTRPDGYVLNAYSGIGTSSYSSMKTYSSVEYLYNKKVKLDCTLIIHKPRKYDYGSWKCILKDERTYDGAIIYVSPNILKGNATQDSDKKVKVSAERVYAKVHETFKVKCTANASLDYCWFRSPDGIPYTASDTSSNFHLGECAKTIEHAYSTHSGEWLCNVGVVNGSEEHQAFLVTVSGEH